MGFANPIVGAINLIRQAIQSPNYVAGVSGWHIDKSGSAEFNSLISRGSFQAGGNGTPEVDINSNGIFVFYANGNLLAEISGSSGNLDLSDSAGVGYLSIRPDGNGLRSDRFSNFANNDPIVFADVVTDGPVQLLNGAQPIYYAKVGLPDLVQGTTNAGPTSGTTPLTIMSSSSITLDGSTKVRVRFQCSRIDTSVANDVFSFAVLDNGVSQLSFRYLARAAADTGFTFEWISNPAPSAGAHTFSVNVTRTSGTGTLTINAAAASPRQLSTVEFL